MDDKPTIDFNIKASELDPTKKYIIEVRRGDLNYEATAQLGKALKEHWGIDNMLVISETGEAINVREVPEEIK